MNPNQCDLGTFGNQVAHDLLSLSHITESVTSDSEATSVVSEFQWTREATWSERGKRVRQSMAILNPYGYVCTSEF